MLPLVDRESSAQEWAQQEPLGPGGWDRFDAEAAMQTSVVETAVARECGVELRGREVAQAVSVAAAYFEDSLQRRRISCWSAGTLGAETLAAMMDESGRGGFAGAGDGGRRNAGTRARSTARVPRGWLAGVRGALRN